ncbi:MAG: four helix bundle protein [Gemmatimonadales bacterium]
MRAARGSAERWNRVGSDTGERGIRKGERDAWCAVFGAGPQDKDATRQKTHGHIVAVKQLASLEAWKCSNELARSAYRPTLREPLSRHFGLADQIRRAAVSVPANLVEGYALGTTIQFVRCLRIALGSAAEVHCHLEIARDLGLVSDGGAESDLKLAERVVRLLVGLLRKLGARTPHTRFPFPHSPFPVTKESREPSS